MQTLEDAMEIRVLWRKGLGIHEIVRRTGRSRNTVRAYICSKDVEPRYGPRKPRILDPYKKSAHPVRLPATVLLWEIRELGYEGQLGPGAERLWTG